MVLTKERSRLNDSARRGAAVVASSTTVHVADQVFWTPTEIVSGVRSIPSSCLRLDFHKSGILADGSASSSQRTRGSTAGHRPSSVVLPLSSGAWRASLFQSYATRPSGPMAFPRRTGRLAFRYPGRKTNARSGRGGHYLKTFRRSWTFWSYRPGYGVDAARPADANCSYALLPQPGPSTSQAGPTWSSIGAGDSSLLCANLIRFQGTIGQLRSFAAQSSNVPDQTESQDESKLLVEAGSCPSTPTPAYIPWEWSPIWPPWPGPSGAADGSSFGPSSASPRDELRS